MNGAELKEKISSILNAALSGREEKYRLDGYIRWGLVEKAIHAVIDESEKPSELAEIGKLLLTQDNQMTADPMFCVQGRRRQYGMDSEYSDETVWIDTSDGVEVIDKPADGEETDTIKETGYYDHWETLCVCFTQAGCEEHLRQNKHNYGHFEETRIYVESFYRNPEMQAVRKFLMELAKGQP